MCDISAMIEEEEPPVVTWVQCDDCCAWRELPDGSGSVENSRWVCELGGFVCSATCGVEERGAREALLAQLSASDAARQQMISELQRQYGSEASPSSPP